MSVRIEKKWIVFDSVTMTPINPKHDLNAEEVKKYLERNPFPETSDYKAEDLLNDIKIEGLWILGDYVTEEQRNYIVEMIKMVI